MQAPEKLDPDIEPLEKPDPKYKQTPDTEPQISNKC